VFLRGQLDHLGLPLDRLIEVAALGASGRKDIEINWILPFRCFASYFRVFLSYLAIA
jgi:hypothetical protein